jgi:hypothetical protein
MIESGLDEIVLLFEDDLSAVASEWRYPDFELLVEGSLLLEQFAASQVKAAYVSVGNKLAINSLVFFLLKIDENGLVTDQFKLPLRYLASQAGLGPDLGGGQCVRVASRKNCPVPWHSKHLWEPQGVGDLHPAKRIQKLVWRNRLGLTSRKVVADVDLNTSSLQQLQATLEDRLQATLDANGSVDVRSLIGQHNQQLQQLATRFEYELAQQQEGHADALRQRQEELQKVRSALRQEKSRSRRLQQLLRGDAQSQK